MSEKLPGSETYIPTRLEWLSVMLNGVTRPSPHGLESFFMGNDDGKTLTLVVIYSDSMPKEFVDSYVDRAKDLAQIFSKKYGWDSWVEVQTDMHNVSSESNDQVEKGS